ncbi:MAG: T9SS type A sorting domain-containing protein [Candidatus Cloacimonetes bacterium]|nr:T9SS type A sorting domain-containing protein [Candidatus Cloacimonadota bacterium]NLO12403.1 T9SS type A sorting domain-containing protein [Candidatus Cloacimonadota bacterium]
MQRSLLIPLLLLTMGLLNAQAFSPWQNFRHSSVNSSSQVHLRWDNVDELVPQPEFWYRLGASGWQQGVSTALSGSTYEAISSYSWGQKLRYRLRTELSYEGVQMAFMHAAWMDDNSFPPDVNKLAFIGHDPAGDSLMIDEPMLDLGDTWMGTSNERIHSVMANQSGSFPTMNSLTSFNLYLTAIANPEALADSVVYAMVYCANIPSVVSPGLYKLGIDESFTPTFARIGNIQSNVSGGKLFMSCNMDDLIGDDSFGAWPNFSNALAFSSFTMRLNLDLSTMTPEVLIGDYSFPGMIFFDDLSYQAAGNTPPVVSDIQYLELGQMSWRYQDTDGDFPLICRLEIDDGEALEMQADGYDYQAGVTYSTQIPVHATGATLYVSDNGIDIQEHVVFITDNQDYLAAPRLECILPNPIRMAQTPAVYFKGLQRLPLQVDIYNLRGQRIYSRQFDNLYSEEQQLMLAGFNAASGLYLFRAVNGNNTILHKFSIIR